MQYTLIYFHPFKTAHVGCSPSVRMFVQFSAPDVFVELGSWRCRTFVKLNFIVRFLYVGADRSPGHNSDGPRETRTARICSTHTETHTSLMPSNTKGIKTTSPNCVRWLCSEKYSGSFCRIYLRGESEWPYLTVFHPSQVLNGTRYANCNVQFLEIQHTNMTNKRIVIHYTY